MKKNLFCILILLISGSYSFAQQDNSVKDSTRNEGAVREELGTSNTNDGQDDEENSSGSYIPSLLHSSNDIFTSNTSYTFSIAYFRTRGYDSECQSVSINNFAMNSLVTGRATYSQWGGLNHVFRFPENALNMNASSFTFGKIGGAMNYTVRASSYRKQVRATYSLSNRTYNHRLMMTYATGVLKSGWSFAASLSGRFGNAISYVDGSVYNGLSYFLAAEKKFSSEHALSLTAFGAPVQRSVQGNAVQDAYDLTETNYYNPNWGWYQGKQRSARIRTIHEPVILLTHYYTPKENKLQITSTIASTFGKNHTTALNWYDVPDPRPDYYRNFPRYQTDTALFDLYTDRWHNDVNVRQIDWNNMYKINQAAALLGKRAQYMVESRNMDHFQLGGTSTLVYNIDNHTKLVAGIDIRGMKQRNYKTIYDLLGGAFWIDVDKYAEGEFPENADQMYNDVNVKDTPLHEGDVFGYDYDLVLMNQNVWAVVQFNYAKVDFHIGADLGGAEFWREGNMTNGRYANNSFGKSEAQNFLVYKLKAGFNYKISGRNYIILNGHYGSEAPSVLNSFVAPRVRNTVAKNLQNEKILSADLSYVMNYPFMKMRVTGYYTEFMNKTKLISFYHDDFSSMVNYSMTGINQRHIGIELGAEIKLGSMFSLILAGNYGDYKYTNRPEVYITADNGTDILSNGNSELAQTIYWQNYKVAGSPQVAATLGLKFNYDYWWVNINANYFDKIYCDINPERHTMNARGTLADDDPRLLSMLEQQRLKGQFTLDASISKSWRIKYKYNIGFNISVTNILNNKNLITTAWQQYRYDFDNYNSEKFGNKYYYAFGTTFYAGINFQF
ncbi:MAG: hypothetical protein LBU51_07185 [Bacteroidales bacterium]|nr:hypothetical protein [Bacteroidales bacterium]